MSMKRALLSLSYPTLRGIRRVRGLQGETTGRLRVALFHDIPDDQRDRFTQQLDWLSRRWTFVTPNQFGRMISGTMPVRGDNLLLTFDDGFRSNRAVAETILDPRGIKAVFFIISSFAELETGDEQRRFIATNLYPPSSGEDVPAHIADMGAMSLDDLRQLVRSGHTIGAHTATHARLSEIVDEEELTREIAGSADRLGERLGVAIEHFSFGFGNLASFSTEALRIARARFPYVYTGMRGDNARGVPPWAIRRDTLAPTDPLWLIGAFTEGAADSRYRTALGTYEGWG